MKKDVRDSIVSGNAYNVTKGGIVTLNGEELGFLPQFNRMDECLFNIVNYLGETIFSFFVGSDFRSKMFPIMRGNKKYRNVAFAVGLDVGLDINTRMKLLYTILTGLPCSKKEDDYLRSINLLYAVFYSHFRISEEDILLACNTSGGGHFKPHKNESLNDYIARLAENTSLTNNILLMV